MPVSTQWTKVRLATPFDPHQQRSIESIGLRAITPFAGAHPPAFVERRLFHSPSITTTLRPDHKTAVQHGVKVGCHSMAESIEPGVTSRPKGGHSFS
jgi:hypothetical protein